MHDLPSVCSANPRALSTVCSEVMIERTSSTSVSTGTGLKKCMPSTRSGREVSAASFMIGTEDVLLARNCASGSNRSSSRNTSRLAGSDSMIASMAASDPATSSRAEL